MSSVQQGSHSHVLVMLSEVFACCLTRRSDPELWVCRVPSVYCIQRGALIHTLYFLFLMSASAVVQVAQLLSCEFSVCRLCIEGSPSHVLVMFSVACACCLAGCSALKL